MYTAKSDRTKHSLQGKIQLDKPGESRLLLMEILPKENRIQELEYIPVIVTDKLVIPESVILRATIIF